MSIDKSSLDGVSGLSQPLAAEDGLEQSVYHVTPVYKASYSNVDVLELEVNEFPVMRRVSDSYFNATQILKLAGIDRSRRSKLLEAEIAHGPHQKVQGGSGRYQGTWVPYERAVELAHHYDLYDVLKPLILYNTETDDQTTLTKAELVTKSQLVRTYSTMTEPDAPAGTGERSNTGSPTKRLKFSQDSLPPLQTFEHDTSKPNPNAPYAYKPLSDFDVDDKSKVVLSSLFLPNQKDVALLELVGGDESQLNDLQVDVPIDDNGQTALHLAATLARTALVKDLVERGSNRLAGDNEGQTALVRAVHATNCYESQCFDKILDYLYPAITVLDHKGRTVLHHIAYTCGRKGRSDACKYYLETLLEWVVRRGPTLPGNQALSLTKFMQDVVNVPDRNGDTCLNIAAMVGNKHIIQQLLEVGADPTKPNKAGVRPTDCGVSVSWPSEVQSKKLYKSHTDAAAKSSDGESQQLTVAQPPETAGTSGTSLRILDSIQSFVQELGKEFQEELELKNSQINNLHPTLRDKTLQLSEKRKQYEQLQQLVRAVEDHKTKVANLDEAIREEDERFQEEAKALPVSSSHFTGNFDADEPFTVWPVFTELSQEVEKLLSSKKNAGTEDMMEVIEKTDMDKLVSKLEAELQEKQKEATLDIPPKVVLQARINAYKKNNELLIERTKARRSSSKELEEQFKRVIALCIGSKPEDIDGKLLDSLLLSVENDPDPEIGQVKKVLEIVNDMEA